MVLNRGTPVAFIALLIGNQLNKKYPCFQPYLCQRGLCNQERIDSGQENGSFASLLKTQR